MITKLMLAAVALSLTGCLTSVTRFELNAATEACSSHDGISIFKGNSFTGDYFKVICGDGSVISGPVKEAMVER